MMKPTLSFEIPSWHAILFWEMRRSFCMSSCSIRCCRGSSRSVFICYPGMSWFTLSKFDGPAIHSASVNCVFTVHSSQTTMNFRRRDIFGSWKFDNCSLFHPDSQIFAWWSHADAHFVVKSVRNQYLGQCASQVMPLISTHVSATHLRNIRTWQLCAKHFSPPS